MTVGARSEWTVVRGRRIHARITEQRGATPIVLVHGLGVSSSYFEPLIRAFAGSYQVFAPDLPGFGRSDAPREILSLVELADELRAWMDVRGLERPVLLGNSMGCQVLIDFAVRAPERVGRLVLVGPTVDPRFRSFGRQVPRWLLEATREPLRIFPALFRDYLRGGVRRFFATGRFALDDRPEEKLPAIAAPTLVMRGEHDAFVTAEWAERVAALLPRSLLVSIEGAPHAAHYTAPREVARRTHEFLTSTTGRLSSAIA